MTRCSRVKCDQSFEKLPCHSSKTQCTAAKPDKSEQSVYSPHPASAAAASEVETSNKANTWGKGKLKYRVQGEYSRKGSSHLLLRSYLEQEREPEKMLPATGSRYRWWGPSSLDVSSCHGGRQPSDFPPPSLFLAARNGGGEGVGVVSSRALAQLLAVFFQEAAGMTQLGTESRLMLGARLYCCHFSLAFDLVQAEVRWNTLFYLRV